MTITIGALSTIKFIGLSETNTIEQNPQSARRNNFPGKQISRWFQLLSENLSASNYPGAAHWLRSVGDAPGAAWWGPPVGWEMALRSSNRQRNVWAVGLLGVEPTDRVLEIGFGPGIAIRELSRRATHGLVCGVDHSAVMVRQATRRNADAVRAGRVDLRVGSAEHLPAFAEPFDKVLAVNNMGMWREPDERLKVLHRLMRPGGRIAIVSQPRCPGATAETTVAAGREIAARLTAAGFMGIRSDTLALKSPVICVLGEVP